MHTQACLLDIARQFNKRHITWALGASMMLHYHGLVAQPRDIDLVVALQDSGPAQDVLQTLGRRLPGRGAAGFATKHFATYTVGGVEVDLMAGLGIEHPGGCYEYRLEPATLDVRQVQGVHIYLCPMADWYVLYSLMPGERAARVSAIARWLGQNPTAEADRRRFWQGQDIPEAIKQGLAAV